MDSDKCLHNRTFKFVLELSDLLDRMQNTRTISIIAHQLLRSAMSIGANLNEAKSSSSRREYKKYFEIALKSANESDYWLRLLHSQSSAEIAKIEKLSDELNQISNMLGASILTIKSKL